MTVAIDRSGLPARTHKHWRAVRLGFTELKIRDSCANSQLPRHRRRLAVGALFTVALLILLAAMHYPANLILRRPPRPTKCARTTRRLPRPPSPPTSRLAVADDSAADRAAAATAMQCASTEPCSRCDLPSNAPFLIHAHVPKTWRLDARQYNPWRSTR
jgi:hypothetical protein